MIINPTIQCHIPEGHNSQIPPCLLTLYHRQAIRLIKYGSQEGVSLGAQLSSN